MMRGVKIGLKIDPRALLSANDPLSDSAKKRWGLA